MGSGPSQSDVDNAERKVHDLEIKIAHDKALSEAARGKEAALREMEVAMLRDGGKKDLEKAKIQAELDRARMEAEFTQKALVTQQEFAARELEYQRKHELELQQYELAKKELEKRLENAEQEFLEGASSLEQYEGNQSEIFQKFCENIEKLPETVKTERPSVAVLGQNGVGKSSLINHLAGSLVTRTGNVDCTKDVCMVHESATTQYYDVPGCNEERSYANLKHIQSIKTMHFIMIVYIDRVEHIVKLERMVRACKVPYVVVRNKIDAIMADEGETVEEAMQQAHAVESKLLASDLCYISAKNGYGVDNLRRVAQYKYGIKL